MNKEEVLQLIEQAAKEGATELDLSFNQLSELPAEIGQLSSLITLYLRGNQLRELPAEIDQLSRLITLNLVDNQLRELPAEIGQLTRLTELDLGWNQLSALPAEIGQLSRLTTLNLVGNQLSVLPAEIGHLSRLTSLYLRGNQLSRLPSEIGQLSRLASLELRGNQLSSLPAKIGQLSRLTRLNLRGNQLSGLPSEIGQLFSLTMLNLWGNQLSALPAEIGQLFSLTTLYLNGNQLSALPAEVGQLLSLTELDLNGNQLSALSAEIGQLLSLIELDLRGNQLSELPAEIGQLSSLTYLDLNDNPLISPPLEIASRGVDAVRQYFNSLDDESEILNELKVLLVGEGSAGKTSLTKRMLGEAFDKNEPTTHGIRIRDWRVQEGETDVKVNIWDFGGQEIMHATHQFFLSKRSLYVLVLDGRRDEKPEYWLQHIESFGGDSPVLIVLNKFDANPAFDINRPFLQQKYPGIKGVFRTSCETDYGIEEFKAALMHELTQVEMMGTRWSNSWFQVKEQLEQLDEHYISADTYEAICEEAEISEQISQDVLVEFLNDLGVIVHFQDFELDDIHVLEPKWVTEAVYKIVNSETVARGGGLLRLRDLRTILKKQSAEEYDYPRDKHKYIIGLMKKFELCYDLDAGLDAQSVLIPQLLDVVEPPFDFDYEDALKFVLRYEDFLPRSVMPRFIVKRHQDIAGELRWRTGVVLANKDFEASAVVRADNEANRIDIFVTGRQRKDYLAIILLFFREIHDSFEKLDVDERVPMPDDPHVTVAYKTLLTHEREKMDKIIPDGASKAYDVHELLGLVQLDQRGDELQEIVDILRRLDVKMDDRESVLRRINRIIDLKPNFAGIGVNGNELIDRWLDAREARDEEE